MFGSDWPVCLLAGNYEEVWKSLNEILADLGEGEREKIFGENAIRFYKLKNCEVRGNKSEKNKTNS